MKTDLQKAADALMKKYGPKLLHHDETCDCGKVRDKIFNMVGALRRIAAMSKPQSVDVAARIAQDTLAALEADDG